MTPCPHCGGDIAIRNPKGFCDHLYYPESCQVCMAAKRGSKDVPQRDNLIVSVVEVHAAKPCEGEFKFTTGVMAQALNICGPARTCTPCVARAIIKEAEGLDLRG